MDKMIKGKKYDTATAKVIGAYTEDEGDRQIQETLYQKRRGSFFLEGSGGATSRYAQRSGSQWVSGSDIIPLSYEEAEEWARTHLSPRTTTTFSVKSSTTNQRKSQPSPSASRQLREQNVKLQKTE